MVEEIKQIIETDNLEKVFSSKWRGLNCIITVNEIDRNENIEKAFKNYIANNVNSENMKYDLKKYELELIKYWEDDLKILCGFHPMIDDSTYFRDERIKFWNLFKKKDIKAYALVNLSDNTGRKIDAEYPYDCGYLFGVIRLYETENERFIISFNWCD